MDKSIFTDKSQQPGDADLQAALAETYPLWQQIAAWVHQQQPKVKDEWHYPGEKYGWSLRIKDSKRAIVYLLPRDGYFKVAFVFGKKAVEEIQQSTIAQSIKTELAAAREYAEGRGIRIDIKDSTLLEDIKKLVEVKVGR